MNDDRLTERLVAQVLGWKVAPGRFIKSDRAWTPSWKFAPLKNLEHAFELLDNAASSYRVAKNAGGNFDVEVRLGARTGKASGQPKARTITIALARALGLEPPEKMTASVSMPGGRRRPRLRNKSHGI
jgi:hypothetical protein